MSRRSGSKRLRDRSSTLARGADATFSDVEPAFISEAIARKVGRAFALRPEQVMLDAQRIATWTEPGDDLLVWLERDHQWRAERALRYLLSLRSALAGELDEP